MGNTMWKLYRTKKRIFDIKDIVQRDNMLYETMSGYFSVNSEFKKI